MRQTIESVFHRRRQRAWRNALIVMQSIMRNGGIFVGGLILIVLTVLGYQRFLAWLPSDAPVVPVLAAILALVVTKCSVRTFVQEPDLVFLLPAEPRMHRYFRQSVVYSAFYQVIQVAYVMGFFYVLYLARIGTQQEFLVALIGLAVLKVWNTYAEWQETLVHRGRWGFWVVRLVINMVLVYFLLAEQYAWLAGGVVLAIGLTFLYKTSIVLHTYPWVKLVEREQKVLATYYAWANFFIDMPQVKNTVQKREWLMKWVRKLPADRKHPYLFLFTRTFVRYSEYFGIYIRLTIFIGVALFFISNYWLALAVYLVGMYMMGIQLPNFSGDRGYPEMIRLYPLTAKQRETSFSLLALRLLGLQSVLLAVPLLISGRLPFLTGLVILLIGVVAAYVLSFLYLPKRYMAVPLEDEKNDPSHD